MARPDFLIIGAQKAGSSWLSENIGEHPDIFVPPQEIYFFNREWERGVAWYETHFDGAGNAAFIGDGTPGYISHPDAPRRIKETLGAQVRLIAALRHPIDRAYSAFWNFRVSHRIPPDADFRTLFARDDQELRMRGFYHEQLARFLEHFPRENLLIFIQEDDLQRGDETIRRCYEFIGANADFVPPRVAQRVNKNHDLRAGGDVVESVGARVSRMTRGMPYALRQPLRLGYERLFKLLPKRDAYQPLDPGLRSELLAQYRDDIARLEDLLGRDLSIWTAER